MCLCLRACIIIIITSSVSQLRRNFFIFAHRKTSPMAGMSSTYQHLRHHHHHHQQQHPPTTPRVRAVPKQWRATVLSLLKESLCVHHDAHGQRTLSSSSRDGESPPSFTSSPHRLVIIHPQQTTQNALYNRSAMNNNPFTAVKKPNKPNNRPRAHAVRRGPVGVVG